MFKSFVVLSFVAFSLTASAAEQTQLPANVFAQVRTSGGFSPRPNEIGVRVFTDGTVVAFNRNSNPQQLLIARLTDRKVAELRAAADHLRLSRLTRLDPNQPACLDAPSTEYAVNTTRAGGMVVARTITCQQSVDQDAAASQLVEVLKGLQALAETDGR